MSARIRLACRQVIDATTPDAFSQAVFQKTYAEFRVQQQSFSKGLPMYTWGEIQTTIPKANPALPFKVSFALGGIMQGLKGKIPGLKDALGDEPVRYAHYRFELLASDAREPSAHRVAIVYVTEELVLHQAIGENLVLTGENGTFLLPLRQGVSVVAYVSNPDTPRIESGRPAPEKFTNGL